MTSTSLAEFVEETAKEKERRMPDMFCSDVYICTHTETHTHTHTHTHVCTHIITQPHFSRVDTRDSFQWRVRNLPYPESTYSVTIDEADNKVVIRTTNKKYYKRFGVPEMDMLKKRLDPDDLSWYHRNNALVISVRAPTHTRT